MDYHQRRRHTASPLFCFLRPTFWQSISPAGKSTIIVRNAIWFWNSSAGYVLWLASRVPQCQIGVSENGLLFCCLFCMCVCLVPSVCLCVCPSFVFVSIYSGSIPVLSVHLSSIVCLCDPSTSVQSESGHTFPSLKRMMCP